MPDIDISRILIFFIYGLSFFSMGLVMLLESGRSPLLAESRILRPLGAFGLVHGVHEWLDLWLYLAVVLDLPIAYSVIYFRLAMLAVSFGFLWVLSLRVLRPLGGLNWMERLVFFGLLVVYGLAAVFLAAALRSGHADWLAHLDSQARYLLAVPGAALAALALQRRSLATRREGRIQIARMFSLTAIGFGLYSVSQLFVPRLDVFPANLVNAAAFQAALGFPVQLVRAFLALGMTFSLIRAAQIAEKERQQAFFDIQQARLEALEAMRHEMDSREALRRELLRHTVIAQEDERARIARELHDETAQVLTAFSLILATFRNTLGGDAAANDLVGRLQGLCRQMSQGIYRLVHDLRPAQLDDLGLVAALQHLADMEQKRLGLAVDLSVIGQRRRLDPLVETVFFRVAQEALTNVARHADVVEAQIELVFGEDQVELQVHDDGRGFDPSSNLVPPHGWGLAGMRERAESIGGALELTSAPGQGATVKVRAPLGEAVGNYREGRENGNHSINVS